MNQSLRRPETTGLNLLVVDDDPAVLGVIQQILESFGHSTVIFSDSRQAVKEVNQRKFDVALVNAGMPQLDGFELARAIRNSPSNASIPIIMLTGYSDIQTMRRAFRAGITFFLAKPPVPRQLQGLLECLRETVNRERRLYARLPLDCSVLSRAGSREFTAKCVNISQGGMLLETSESLEVGEMVELTFFLPQVADPVCVNAGVIRTEGPGRIAVQFADLDLASSEAIAAYMAGLVPDLTSTAPMASDHDPHGG